jgi:pyruvate dehydrogenase E2 component (dihydrolipoyllysine-residue acetyltransferase)
MASTQQLRMPKLGLTMTEGSVVDWPVAEGERFAAGDIYVVVENDKAENEIEAPASGRLTKILVPAGETVPVGTVLAEWASDAEQTAGRASEVPAPAAAVPEAQSSRPRRVKADAMTRATARKLTQSKQTIPHFYLSTEIDAGALLARRDQYNAGAQVKASLTHLLLRAAAQTLAAHPELNRVWEDEYLVDLPSVDIGIAVHSEKGLLVPMLRGADKLSLEEISLAAGELVERARVGKLQSQDAGGGALTISNAGMYDVTYMASIINPGQAAILGVGSPRKSFRPDEAGAPRLVTEIGVVLSVDHRVLGGVPALTLLNDIRERLEAPGSLVA